VARPRPFRPLRQAIETGLLALLAWFVRLIPLEAAGELGARLGSLAHRLLARRRRIAEENLRSALGLSEQEAAGLARDVFRQLGRSFLEFLALPAQRLDALERRIEFDHGFDRIPARRAGGRGLILLTAHYGNWELLGARVARRIGGVAYVFPAQANAGTDAIINATRRRMGIELIPMEQGMRRAMKRLVKGGNIGMLPDQDARKLGIHVPFFGRPASTLTGPARLAIRARCPIFFAVLDRVGAARFRARTIAWIEPADGADEEAEVERITGEINAALEGAVRARPDHWYWIHRRWKTPPPAEDPAAPLPPGADARS
jgi:KDO2-lipid IV(A) lauroyltransferase